MALTLLDSLIKQVQSKKTAISNEIDEKNNDNNNDIPITKHFIRSVENVVFDGMLSV